MYQTVLKCFSPSIRGKHFSMFIILHSSLSKNKMCLKPAPGSTCEPVATKAMIAAESIL